MRRFEDALLDLILREPAREGRTWMIVDDDRVGNPVKAIEVSARTGSMGDRRIFISPVEAACTVRTGEPDDDRSPSR
jgi:nitrogen regulatory protein PII